MPASEEILKVLKEKYKGAVTGSDSPARNRLFVDIKKEKVREISNEIVGLG